MPPSLAKRRHGPSTACKRAVSGTISLPSQGFFSPFPHGTGSLSVANEYLALPDGPGRFPQGSSCPAVLRNHWKARSHFHLQGCHLLWPAFPDRSINAFLSLVTSPDPGSLPRPGARWCLWSCNPALSLRIARFRLFRFRSPLLSESRLFSSPPGTEMVHFPGFASPPYEFRRRFLMFAPGGFPHSDISGSQPVSGSPKLFAAGHVLLRLFAPRHPHARS